MHKLIEHQNNCSEFKRLFEEALQSDSVESKKYILNQFHNSELLTLNAENIDHLIRQHGATVPLINIGKALPGQIAEVKKMAALLESQLEAKRVETIARFKASLKPYIDKTNDRTTEYSWGTIEYMGSFFGVSGHGKSQKLSSLTEIIKSLEAKSTSVLGNPHKLRLTTRTLGDAFNPWLDDPVIGEELKRLLLIEPNNEHQMNHIK